MPADTANSREPLDSRLERPAFVFRVGLVLLILAHGVLRSLRPYQVPSDTYLFASAGYAVMHASWWSIVAVGFRPGRPSWFVPVGQLLGALTDLVAILFLATLSPHPHGLWLMLLLPWSLALAHTRQLVASIMVFDSLVGLCGVFVLFAGPNAYQYLHTPTSVLLFWGGFFLSWYLLRQRLERDLETLRDGDAREAKWTAVQSLLDRVPVGCLVLSGSGRVSYRNAEAARMLGSELPEEGGAPDWLLEFGPESGWRVRRQGEEAPVRRLLHQRQPVDWCGDETASLILLEDGDARSQRGEHEARQERLAAVGQLAAGLAHELGNPIAIIQSCASFLHDEHKEGDLGEDLVVIQRESARCREMIDRMLALARARQSAPQEGDLRESVHRAVSLVRYKADDVALEVILPPEPVVYVYDDNQLVAILVNLLLNAIASTKNSERREVRLDLAVSSGGVNLSISDTGCGIPVDQLERVFDPFFTQREGGTGLGLAMVHHVVTALGGKIDVSSTVGEGTRFAVFLPDQNDEEGETPLSG